MCSLGVGRSICRAMVISDPNSFDRSTCPECHADGQCVYYYGATYCQCKPGFASKLSVLGFITNDLLTKADIAQNPQVCFDLNECDLRLASCTPNAACTNTIGSFVCSCPAGTRGTGYYESECVDINECSEYVQNGTQIKLMSDCDDQVRRLTIHTTLLLSFIPSVLFFRRVSV
jgi:hypothetical protein